MRTVASTTRFVAEWEAMTNKAIASRAWRWAMTCGRLRLPGVVQAIGLLTLWCSWSLRQPLTGWRLLRAGAIAVGGVLLALR